MEEEEEGAEGVEKNLIKPTHWPLPPTKMSVFFLLFFSSKRGEGKSFCFQERP